MGPTNDLDPDNYVNIASMLSKMINLMKISKKKFNLSQGLCNPAKIGPDIHRSV